MAELKHTEDSSASGICKNGNNHIREKLVELLECITGCAVEECRDCALSKNIEQCVEFRKKWLTDKLLANGVTVSEWIPVSERLPDIPDGWAECPNPVLFVRKGSEDIYAGYYGENGTYRDKYFRQYADAHEGVDAADVLCWMWQHDLPQPPKGE